MAEAAPNTGEAQGELALVPVSTASTGLTNEEEFSLGESEREGYVRRAIQPVLPAV